MKMHFIIPSIPNPVRFAIYGLFIAAGTGYQFFYPGASWVLGWLIMAAGTVFIVAKGFFNKPADLGFEDWQPASKTEFARINQNLTMTNEAKYPFYFKKQTAIVFGFALVTVIFLIAMFSDTPDALLILALIDSAVILLPVFLSGAVRLWMPQDLKLKMESLNIVMDEAEAAGDRLIITPYIRLDKDKAGRHIPEDVRLMLEPKRKPDELVGVQIQVAINNGPNGAVPYMYAVFLCKGKGALFQAFKARDYGDMVKEPGGDKEYGYVVVRQQTGGGGYHTDSGDCSRLFGIVSEALLPMGAS
jgi:hypothetical protein